MYRSSSPTSFGYTDDLTQGFQGVPGTWSQEQLRPEADLPAIYKSRSSGTLGHSLVFIDAAIASYQDLANAATPGTEVIILDPLKDEIAQITSVLSQQHNISSLQLISHGSAGGFQLGQTYYDLSALSQRSSELASWAGALTEDADILLYGCDVAAGSAGIQFVNYLSQTTGADVAASTNLTGSAALGGDWTLEYVTGAIESGLAFKKEALLQYGSILPYLSDLSWTTATNGWGPVELDRSNGEQAAGDGTTLTLNGVTYTKGLGAHAGSDITYALNGAYSRFTAALGVDDEVGSNGSVVFQVFADTVKLYDSGLMTGSTATKSVDVDVTGRQNLRLVVTDGGNGNGGDHADWANAQLSVAGPDTTAPTATAALANVTSGASTYDFTVTYTDNQSINVSTIDGNDVLVTGPNGFSQLASFVSVPPTGNGTPRTATYRITAPGGTWDLADNGTYTVSLQANQVADTSGNAVAASTLGNLLVNIVPDSAAPTVSSTTLSSVTTSGGTTYSFTVAYSDDQAINVSTLDNNDIRVTGPNGFNQLATFVSVTPTGNGTPRTATYRITAPGGIWDTTDNGTYTVALQANQVADPSGNAVVAATLGTFLVNAPNFTYLSDLSWTTATNGWGPVELDRSNGEQAAGDGTTLTLNGVTYTKGLGAHAGSDITYALNGAYSRFTAALGVDDEVGSNGSVVFQVFADTVKLYDSGLMTGSTATKSVDVDVTGRQNLRLVVTDGGNGNGGDHADWANAQLSVAGPDTTAPTATAALANVTSGASTYDFTVTYTDNQSINVSTIDGNDVLVTGPNGFSQLASFVSVPPTGNGTPRTATYRITAPGGTWDLADNGTYTVSLQANQVADTSGNAVAASTLGNLLVNIVPDSAAPTVSSTTLSSVTTSGGTTYSFTVAYSDDQAINVSTLDNNDIRVTGPNGFNQLATFVSVTPTGNGTPRTATYRITAPGGIWDTTDNGTYTVALQANQVADPSGNAVVAATLGTFLVNAPNFTYLSDLSWTTATNGWGPVELDRSNGEQAAGDGTTLTLNGVTYTKGLGAHAGSDITYALNGAYSRFTAALGVDDEVGSNGSVVFQVFADTVKLYDSGLMTGSTATKSVDVDVTGRQNLRLVVTDGGNGNGGDHADWANAQLSVAGPDTTAPTATAALANVTSGASTYDFTVTYTDNQSINVSTIDGNDVLVTGPNGFSQLASFVSVPPTGNGTPRTATYRITAPGGTWDLADNGTYTVSLQANQVADTSGNAVAASTLGNLLVNIVPDSAAPTAALTAATLSTSRTTPYTFTVAYTDATVVNVSSINSTDIRVTGPNSYSQLAQLVSVTPNSNGTPLTATYQITAPDTIWNWNDRGTYTTTLLAGEVRDTLGNTTTIDTVLGSFDVTVASTIVLGVNSSQVAEGGTVTIPIQRTGDTTGTATIDYFTGGNSTAVAGVNYVSIPVTRLTFAPGESQKNVVVQTLDDGVSGTNKTVSLLIETPTGADLGPSRTSSISITDKAAVATRTYVSDLNWTTVTNGWGPVEKDKSNGEAGTGDGRTISLDGFTYTKGLGVHAGSDITYALNGTYNSFFAYIGVDDEVGIDGSVVFQIFADNTQLFDSGVMTGSSATKLVNVDVTGKQTLRLVVTDGGNGNAADHADWADAQLVVGSYTPPPPPSPLPPPSTSGFVREQVVGGLNQPTTFDWSPDNKLMFIAEKGGVVKVYVDGSGLRATPFIDISSQVNNVADRGLLGLAVDPFFAQNRGRDYVYLLFTYDSPETRGQTGLAGPDQAGNRPARLIRVTADPATNYTTAIAGSEVILLGKNSLWQYTSRPDADSTDNFSLLPSGINNGSTINAPANLIEDPDLTNRGRDYSSTDTNFDLNNNIRDYLSGDSQSHNIGQIKFGLDGALYVTVGDGTSYNGVDWRATRVQDIDNLSGKLLRINPLTGQGLSDNPFYNGDPDSNRSKVWSYGLRNSFRFTVQPVTGALVLADVGWATWEELDVATKGANLGWPYFEGVPQNSGYATLPQAQAFYNSGQTVVSPFLARNHAASQNPDGRAATALIMGDFYSGSTFPTAYNGALFYNDVGLGYVYVSFLDSSGAVTSTQVFDNLSYIVDMETGSDSNLYYASLYGGEIGRWRYS